MKLFVQVGNLGSSVVDHLISPIAYAANVQKLLLFCHHSGYSIPKVEYHYPPAYLAKFKFLAIVYEFANLLFLAAFNRSVCIMGCLLSPHGIIALVAAKLTRKRVIISLIAGRGELYTKGSIQGIDFNKTQLPKRGRLFLKLLKHTDKIITTGSVTKDFLVKHGIPDSIVYPIISPPNRSRFYPVSNITKNYDVISVGSLSIIKHQEVLLQTVREIKKRYPKIKACIVGNGPRKYSLIRLAVELGVEENIDFVGYQENVPYYYNSSRIFVHTSEREGFPNVFLEAMTCGLPCVVSNCGDIIDIAKDGFNSFIIQNFNDYEGFTEAIIKLLENKELYIRMSHNAVQSMELLSLEDVAHKWERILSK